MAPGIGPVPSSWRSARRVANAARESSIRFAPSPAVTGPTMPGSSVFALPHTARPAVVSPTRSLRRPAGGSSRRTQPAFAIRSSNPGAIRTVHRQPVAELTLALPAVAAASRWRTLYGAPERTSGPNRRRRSPRNASAVHRTAITHAESRPGADFLPRTLPDLSSLDHRLILPHSRTSSTSARKPGKSCSSRRGSCRSRSNSCSAHRISCGRLGRSVP